MLDDPSSLHIWGTGGHAISVLETALVSGFTDIAFIDQYSSVGAFEGFPLLNLEALKDGGVPPLVVIAVGDNSTRRLVSTTLEKVLGRLSFATLVHPSAVVASSASLGPGTVVLQGAIIGAKSRVGDHCIVNTGATLDHESSMGDFSSLEPGVVTGGRVGVGERSAIGIGATIRHGVRIGQDTVVGSASYVHEDLPNNVVVYGTPAQVVRPRNGDDPYLS